MVIFKFYLFLCYSILVFKLFLLLTALDCQKIVDGLVNEDIECAEEQRGNTYLVKCYSHCSTNCTCLLDDDKVISNCTDGHVAISHVIIYVPYVAILSWQNSILHDIKPGAFLRFGSKIREIYLYNVSLQRLQHGVFAGLENLTHMILDYNKIRWVAAGVFENLVQLHSLSLSNNMIHGIEQGTFNDILQLNWLLLDSNLLTKIETGVFQNLLQLHTLSLSNNLLSGIQIGQYNGLKSLKILHLYNNSINVIEAGSFSGLIDVDWINLGNNYISYLAPTTFGEMRNLTSLHILHNNITTLHADTFQNLTKLDYLEIQYNKLQFLPNDIFHNLQQLRYLNLSFNNMYRIPAELFLLCIRLETVDLQENPLMWIEKHALASLNESVQLVVTDFATCCFTSAHCISAPPLSPYITCKRLLPYELLRIATWFVCCFAVLGNCFVFYSRVKKKQQRHKVQTFLITNLSISDFLMGLYLISLLSADLYYKDYFPSHSEGWRSSILCRVAGALSVLSSEASVFFITLITIDRFFGVKYTFSRFRFGIKSARIVVALLWTISFSIAFTVFVLSQKDSDLYAVSEVCVGLPISRISSHLINETAIIPLSTFYSYRVSVFNYINTGSEAGMFLSIALFTCFNLICFFIVGYCYLAIFMYVRKTTKQSGRSPNLNEEIRMAIEMCLLVFTDFCCWVPIGFLSILVQAGVTEVDPVAYAWIATFVLPINSSINPFLYTLASFISDKVKILRKETSQKKTQEERVPMKSAKDQGIDPGRIKD